MNSLFYLFFPPLRPLPRYDLPPPHHPHGPVVTPHFLLDFHRNVQFSPICGMLFAKKKRTKLNEMPLSHFDYLFFCANQRTTKKYIARSINPPT